MTFRPIASLLIRGLLGLTSRPAFAAPQLVQQQHLAAAINPGLSVPPNGPKHVPFVVEHGSDDLNRPGYCRLSSGRQRYLNEGFDSYPLAAYVPSMGALNATMIFVDFDDAQASENTTDLYQHFVPGASEWYRSSSFGRLHLQITPDLSRFYRMPRNSSSYDYNRGNGQNFHRKYIQDTLDVVGTNISFESTDLLYIVPTKEASAISYSPTFMPSIQAADGSVIKKTVTFGQDMYYFGFKVMNHETGHTMGLPDTYSYEPRTRATIFVGGYDLMAEIEGISPDYFAWHKWRLGCIDDDQIACLSCDLMTPGAQRYVLTPIEEATGLKAIIFRYNATFAVVAETRFGTGLNTNTCGKGVLVYTVHTLVPTGRGPIIVQDSSPQSAGCAREKLNDALFMPKPPDRRTFLGFGVNITVVEEIEEGFVVEVQGT